MRPSLASGLVIGLAFAALAGYAAARVGPRQTTQQVQAVIADDSLAAGEVASPAAAARPEAAPIVLSALPTAISAQQPAPAPAVQPVATPLALASQPPDAAIAPTLATPTLPQLGLVPGAAPAPAVIPSSPAASLGTDSTTQPSALAAPSPASPVQVPNTLPQPDTAQTQPQPFVANAPGPVVQADNAAAPPSPTSVPPTSTAIPPTPTLVPPTATPFVPTPTPVPPTATPTPTPVPPSPTPTFTPFIPTSTPTPTRTPTLVPTLTPTPTPIPTATWTPTVFVPHVQPTPIGTTTSSVGLSGGTFNGRITPYADSLAGNSMGCSGSGPYSPADASIVAVNSAYYTRYPCGTRLQICSAITCVFAYRKDACPGCEINHFDVSRTLYRLLCGSAPYDCDVTARPQ